MLPTIATTPISLHDLRLLRAGEDSYRRRVTRELSAMKQLGVSHVLIHALQRRERVRRRERAAELQRFQTLVLQRMYSTPVARTRTTRYPLQYREYQAAIEQLKDQIYDGVIDIPTYYERAAQAKAEYKAKCKAART